MDGKMTFTIKGDPRTKKNSMQIYLNGSRRRVAPSNAYQLYESAALWQIPCVETIERPVDLQVVYYMKTRGRVGLVSLLQATCALLEKAKVLKDDNCTIVKSMDGSRVLYDKENPRAEVTITELQE